MPGVDFTGAQGGLMGMAFGAGWALASAMWIAVGGMIWRFFIEPRVKGLEADRAKDQVKWEMERAADRARCEAETARLQERITQLETMLMLHGPQQLRQAMQAVASEAHTEVRELRAVVAEGKK